jgi:hypothetical protein
MLQTAGKYMNLERVHRLKVFLGQIEKVFCRTRIYCRKGGRKMSELIIIKSQTGKIKSLNKKTS